MEKFANNVPLDEFDRFIYGSVGDLSDSKLCNMSNKNPQKDMLYLAVEDMYIRLARKQGINL